jgi:hypothetical protein
MDERRIMGPKTLACISLLGLSLAFGPLAPRAWSQSAATQPSSQAVQAAQLQVRANEDMAKGDYFNALPLLLKASTLISDKPDALGPVLEEIRMCRKQMVRGNTVVAPPPAAALASPAPDLSVNRTPHPAVKPGEKLAIAIKELGNFEYDEQKGGGIPDDVKALEGVHFETNGYMVPLDQAEAITEFALVPSLFACCYGQPPQIQHTIVVQVAKGKAISYYPDQITVEGTLHVSEQKDGGFIVSIFQMDATSVRTFKEQQ